MKDHYSSKEARFGPEQTLEFKKDKITLNIPKEGVDVGDWRVRPLATPVVILCVAHCSIREYVSTIQCSTIGCPNDYPIFIGIPNALAHYCYE